MKRCLICAKDIEVTERRYAQGHGRYCSKLCQIESRKKGVLTRCVRCTKIIRVTPSRVANGRGKYCGKVCHAKSTLTPVAHKFIKGQTPANFKGFTNTHGKKRDGYILIFKPNHPNATSQGYIREHRLIVEQYLGRYLTREEVIHHRDFNKTNNDIGNLLVLSRSEHDKLHASLKRGGGS